MRWYFTLPLAFVAIIHIRSDKALKVTLVLSAVIILTPQINCMNASLPELYKQIFFPSNEVNLHNPVSLICFL